MNLGGNARVKHVTHFYHKTYVCIHFVYVYIGTESTSTGKRDFISCELEAFARLAIDDTLVPDTLIRHRLRRPVAHRGPPPSTRHPARMLEVGADWVKHKITVLQRRLESAEEGQGDGTLV
jgi:hypothetical protein